MLKYFISILFLLLSFAVNSNENLLTIQQQLERLQREVSDISKTVFSNNNSTSNNNDDDLVTNLSAIDMRIYDLEKDVKNLTSNVEDVSFQFEDIISKINDLENLIMSFENSLLEIKKISNAQENQQIIDKNENVNNTEDQETLGTLKITSENENTEDNDNTKSEESITAEVKLTPEDQFQIAFDNIRSKNWKEAKNSFIKFIENHPENQLSGSAHYWLGELYILEKQYRDAALIFAEGYQKFPESIKSPDMLYKLSLALYEVNKINESCKTLEKLILDYPKNKITVNAKKQLQTYGCLDVNE